VVCPQCQTMNESNSAFCGNCGTSLIRPAARPGSANSLGQPVMPPGPAASGMPWTPGMPGKPSPPGQYPPGGQYAPGGPYPPVGQPGPGSQYPPRGRHGSARQPGPAPRRPAAAFRLDLRRLGRAEQTVGGASLIVLISLFLPWYGLTVLNASFSVSGTSAHGYLVIALLVALLLIGYLVVRAGWEELPVNLPIAHAPLLLLGTGLQFLLVLIGFLDKPTGLSWEIGAYLALIAAAAATAPVVIPAIRSWQASR
jgi:zinc-ribbon domain